MGLTWLRILALLESLCSHLFFLCLGVGLGGPVWMLTGPVSIPGRYWETVERLRINQFYGAPTAIRLLLRYGDEWVKKYDRSSLKVLGSGKCSSTGWSSKSLGITLCLFPQMPRAAAHETPKSGDCTIWGWLHKQALGSSVLNLIFQLLPPCLSPCSGGTHQQGGMGMVLPCGRRDTMSSSGHLVANW